MVCGFELCPLYIKYREQVWAATVAAIKEYSHWIIKYGVHITYSHVNYHTYVKIITKTADNVLLYSFIFSFFCPKFM